MYGSDLLVASEQVDQARCLLELQVLGTIRVELLA
jgi:hypothetical protein